MATDWSAFSSKPKDKKEEDDGGLLGKAISAGMNLSPLSWAARASHAAAPDSAVDALATGAAKNVEGAAQMFNPVSLVPNLVTGIGGGLAGTGKELSRLPATLAAGLSGQSADALDKSPLSFMVNTDLLRASQADTPLVQRLHDTLGQVAPIVNTVADPIAETGLRGGSLAASAVSQVGGPFHALSPEEMLAQSGNGEMSFEARTREGKGLSTLIGDAMAVAPALRGGASLLPAEGAAAGRLSTAANAIERAPLAPVSVPGKALYEGFKRAAAGETAFPALNDLASTSSKAIAGLPEVSDVVKGLLPKSPITKHADEANANLAKAQARMAEAVTAPERIQATFEGVAKGGNINDAAAVSRRAERARLKGVAEELPARRAEVVAAQKSAMEAQEALATETADLTAQVEGERAALKPTLRGDIAQKVEGGVQAIGDVWAKTAARNEAFRNYADRLATFKSQPGYDEIPAEAGKRVDSSIKAQAIEDAKVEFLRQRGQLEPGEGLVGIDAKGNKFKVDDDGNIINKNKSETNSRAMRQAQQFSQRLEEQPALTKQENIGQGSLFDEPQVGRSADAPVMYVPERTLKLAEQAMQGVKGQASGNAITNLVDDVTRGWKTGVLPLNPAWQVNNMLSNSMTAMTHGGIDPIWFWHNKGRIAEAMDNPPEGMAHALGAGAGHEFMTDTAKTTKFGRGVDKVGTKAYALNSKFDDMAHMAVALKKFDDLTAKGMTREAAARTATDFARKTMGDFENMSPFEKNVMKRAIPFYTWAKHSAKFNLRELVENPVRQTRLAAASQAIAPPGQEDNGDFLASAIPLGGGRFLNSGALNMGQGLTGGITSNPLANPKAALGASNPILQAALALDGIDAKTGTALSVAPDQSFLSGAAGYLTNQAAPTRTLADTIERIQRGDNVAKGDVRNVLTAGGHPYSTRTEGGVAAPLLKFLTGASIQEPDLKGQAKRAKKADKAAASKEKKYAKDSQKSVKK